MKHPLPLVTVTWADAWKSYDSGVAPAEIDHNPKTYVSVGWLVKRDRIGVSLAFEYDDEGQVRSVTFIPAGMIQSVRTIK